MQIYETAKYDLTKYATISRQYPYIEGAVNYIYSRSQVGYVHVFYTICRKPSSGIKGRFFKVVLFRLI